MIGEVDNHATKPRNMTDTFWHGLKGADLDFAKVDCRVGIASSSDEQLGTSSLNTDNPVGEERVIDTISQNHDVAHMQFCSANFLSDQNIARVENWAHRAGEDWRECDSEDRVQHDRDEENEKYRYPKESPLGNYDDFF